MQCNTKQNDEDWSYSGENNVHMRGISIRIYCARSDKDLVRNNGGRGETLCSPLMLKSTARSSPTVGRTTSIGAESPAKSTEQGPTKIR